MRAGGEVRAGNAVANSSLVRGAEESYITPTARPDGSGSEGSLTIGEESQGTRALFVSQVFFGVYPLGLGDLKNSIPSKISNPQSPENKR